MALELPFSKDNTGEDYPKAYQRIVQILLSEEDKRAVISIGIYKDKAARTAGKTPVSYTSVTAVDRGATVDKAGVVVTPASPDYTGNFTAAALDAAKANPVSQAYAYVKKQDAYKASKDV